MLKNACLSESWPRGARPTPLRLIHARLEDFLKFVLLYFFLCNNQTTKLMLKDLIGILLYIDDDNIIIIISSKILRLFHTDSRGRL